MKVLYGVIQDFDRANLQEVGKFVWVSFLYKLFDDVIFLVDFFPDSTYKCSLVREDMI